jgi:ribosomal protein S12 methylthiotransferase
MVNTCGFLEAAKAESVEALQELAENKRPGQSLVAAGCMVQRFGPELVREVPGLDGLIGTRSWPDIISFLGKLRDEGRKEPIFHLPETGDVPVETVALSRTALGPRASAYLKISDGCSAPCAFCTIPGIKGQGRSRPKETILGEAQALVEGDVRELILIAQDTTAYGRDRGERDGLPTLIEDLLHAAPGLSWLRLMYAYPGHVSQRLIDVMAAHSQVCHYLDMPLQHSHPDTLRRMRRPHNVEKLTRWIEAFRSAIPDAALRTTFIVGYPGETEAEFQGLLDFMREVQFDRVGIFTFSREPGTPAYEDVKQERYERASKNGTSKPWSSNRPSAWPRTSHRLAGVLTPWWMVQGTG